MMIQTGFRSKAWILLFLIMAIGWSSQAQDVTLHGFVKDSATGTALSNASISVKGLHGGARSNAQGHFRIPITQRAVVITVTSVGYNSQTLHLDSVPDYDVVFSL